MVADKDTEKTLIVPPQRLCSEIQLFDLCDLDSCKFKNGRFCSDSMLVARFEKISEKEQRVQALYESDDLDGFGEGDGTDNDEFYEVEVESSEDEEWSDD